jgi:hypothetical protein
VQEEPKSIIKTGSYSPKAGMAANQSEPVGEKQEKGEDKHVSFSQQVRDLRNNRLRKIGGN